MFVIITNMFVYCSRQGVDWASSGFACDIQRLEAYLEVFMIDIDAIGINYMYKIYIYIYIYENKCVYIYIYIYI